jgi:hypothetical protein
VYFSLGVIYEKQDDKRKAREYYKLAALKAQDETRGGTRVVE